MPRQTKFVSEDRIQNYNKIKKELEDGGGATHLIKKNRLGKGEQGVVYKGLLLGRGKDRGLDLVIKRGYLERKEAKLIYSQKDQFSKKALQYEAFIEIAATILVTELVKQRVCPNFVMTYSYRFKERDTVCDDQYPAKVYLFNEWIPGVQLFDTFCQNEKHSLAVWFNSYFQILAGIYAMQETLGMAHADLHSDNILVATVKKGGHWKYTIDGVDYYVPNLGYQFLINDFGHAWIPGKMESWYVREHVKPKGKKQKNIDPLRIFKLVLEYSVAPKRVKDIVDLTVELFKDTSVEIVDIIYTIFGSYFLMSEMESSKKLETSCRKEPYFCYFKKLRSKQIDSFDLDKGIEKGDINNVLWKLI
jgi:serine/threonine protein kinase